MTSNGRASGIGGSRSRGSSGLFAAFLVLAAGCSSTGSGTTPAFDPSEAGLSVLGDIPEPMRFSIADLEALGAATVPWEHEGERKDVRGVPMEAVLRKVGWDVGPGGREAPPSGRRTGWRRAILAKSRDGYRMAFSCAELTADNGPSRVYVVWQENGAALGQDVGPIRLVVPTDRKGARSIRQLFELEVIDLTRGSR